MRICQVSHGFTPVLPKGADALAILIHNLSRELTLLGHKVDVIDVLNPSRKRDIYTVFEIIKEPRSSDVIY